MNTQHVGRLVALFLMVAAAGTAKRACSQDAPLTAPPGFEVTQFAADDLAHDVYSLTLDGAGRVVASGAGYIKVLIDSDHDGRADRAQMFVEGPKTGAQGMAFHGKRLLCIGDAGLLGYVDENRDDQADGLPEVYWRFRTGREHDVHSIQQGPDGCWYVIAGNDARVDSSYARLPSSPVKSPVEGVLLRFQPDLSGGEIVCDGMRNAYDFAFSSQGDIFTYDSDDERDISLPSYRQTRVFHLLPQSNCGWISKSWRRPNLAFEMPPIAAELGRGSPTGVACYRHTQFPAKYRGALFALDWTYGRVIALPLEPAGSSVRSKPELFLSSSGTYGFAPTDLEVAPDGSIYVSVGGRGTQGGVYRIRYVGSNAANPSAPPKPVGVDGVLAAPQPLAAWSRETWTPEAKRLGRAPFLTAAMDAKRTTADRIRAIEVLTETSEGLDAADLAKFQTDATPDDVAARAVWSYARRHAGAASPDALAPFLKSTSPRTARAVCEACLPLPPNTTPKPLIPGLVRWMAGRDRTLRWLAARVAGQFSEDQLADLSRAATEAGPRAVVSYAFAWLYAHPRLEDRLRSSVPGIGLALLEGDYEVDVQRDAIRLMQVALGDVGPGHGLAPAFDGYAPSQSLAEYDQELDPLRIRLAAIVVAQRIRPELTEELDRVAAMLALPNPQVLDQLTARLTAESDPVADIHALAISARIPASRTGVQRERIASAFLRLEPKLRSRKLPQDLNWDDRVKEIYAAHAKADLLLPGALIAHAEFGQPGHVAYLSELTANLLAQAIQGFARTIASTPDYAWTNEVVFLLGESPDPSLRELIRDQYDRPETRSAVLIVLADKPDPADRSKFREALEASAVDVQIACLDALGKLPADAGPDEQLALVRALRRLGQDEREFVAREKVVKLLARNTGQKVAFEFGKTGYKPQAEAVQAWTDWFAQKWPKRADALFGSDAALLADLTARLDQLPWTQGDAQRGRLLFQAKQCANCHGGRTALGPDLNGVAGRFSKTDLFAAIVSPNRDVSPRYQTTLIETRSGKTFVGLVVYESVDGLLLRDGSNRTFRVETSDVESRRKLATSLMPAGLLNACTDQNLVDLYAYLESLSKPAAAAGK